jgi:hypothetical protein
MTDAPASERPTFLLRLRAEPHVANPVRALRSLLKIALRKFGLRCLSAEPVTAPAPITNTGVAASAGSLSSGGKQRERT